jgi:dihydroneopterin aldolase
MVFCVNIEGIKAFGKHGVTDVEKQSSQIFQIDVYYEYVIANDAFVDDISAAVDYKEIVHIVVSTVRNSSFNLVEKLSLELNKRIRAIERIIGVTTTVKKLSLSSQMPCDSISIELRDY